MVKTPHFNCKGCGFDPWLGNKYPTCLSFSNRNKIGFLNTIPTIDHEEIALSKKKICDFTISKIMPIELVKEDTSKLSDR